MSLQNLNDKLKSKPTGFVRAKIREVKARRKIEGKPKPKKGFNYARAGQDNHGDAQIVKIPKVMRTLLDAITEDDLDGVALAWREALKATTYTFDYGDKRMIECPDHGTRIKAANMIAAYKDGLPIQKQIQLQVTFEDLNAVMGRLRTSPAAEGALKILNSLPSDPIRNESPEAHEGIGPTDSLQK